MTVVPLPDTPCVRARMIWNEGAEGEGSNRFYLSYGGSAPSGTDCQTLATDIEAAWLAHLAIFAPASIVMNEVDVIDIATDLGLSGQWTGAVPGTSAGTASPANCAVNVEFGIARRYRGGKPRMYLPPLAQAEQLDLTHWNPGAITPLSAAVVAFFAQIEALSIGAMGPLTHVNLSYYKGFTNITNSSGRERAVPKYRDAALHDNITGYFARTLISSQRRRRTSTTP